MTTAGRTIETMQEQFDMRKISNDTALLPYTIAAVYRQNTAEQASSKKIVT